MGKSDEAIFKNGPWDELKRLVFLRFVLAFGLGHSQEEQLKLLVGFDKGTFRENEDESVQM